MWGTLGRSGSGEAPPRTCLWVQGQDGGLGGWRPHSSSLNICLHLVASDVPTVPTEQGSQGQQVVPLRCPHPAPTGCRTVS